MSRADFNANRPVVLVLWAVSMAAVGWLSLLPGTGEPPEIEHLDKVQHFLAYAWLTLLAMRGFGQRRAAISAAGAMVFLGAVLEVAQAFVPHRDPSLLDMAANALGVFAGIRLGIRLKTREAMKRGGLDKWYNADGSRKKQSKP